ncbi:uncharacterized protein LOC105020687 isoform X5 [Esox lucius]|uniref:uncharacterized protein LOC105020687 isoform X5 n=1 Tax=Esox lucius TaxID=8010 RepID=UPI0014768A43|nr:uncharacterized protein LOC105020687 isoform X5 [Esox lucius]
MGDLQTQLTSILNSLVKVAVVELLRVVQDSAVELRLEVSQSKLENEALKIENESNQKRLKTLEAELSTAENRRCSYCRVGCFGSKTDDEYADGPITFSEDDDASWLQQSESAHTVEKITVIENDEMQYLIKKEQHVDIHGRKDTPVSSDDENQPCPKVDMVFDKEWSQSLWQGGEAFKEEEEDSSGLEDEDTPGPSATHRQSHFVLAVQGIGGPGKIFTFYLFASLQEVSNYKVTPDMRTLVEFSKMDTNAFHSARTRTFLVPKPESPQDADADVE